MYWFNKHSKHPCINVTLKIALPFILITGLYQTAVQHILSITSPHTDTHSRESNTRISRITIHKQRTAQMVKRLPLERFDFTTKTSTKKLHKNNDNNKTTSKVCTYESSISVRLKESIQGVDSIANNTQIRRTIWKLQLTFPVCELLLFPALLG